MLKNQLNKREFFLSSFAKNQNPANQKHSQKLLEKRD